MKIALTVILNFKNGAIHLLRCPQLGDTFIYCTCTVVVESVFCNRAISLKHRLII